MNKTGDGNGLKESAKTTVVVVSAALGGAALAASGGIGGIALGAIVSAGVPAVLGQKGLVGHFLGQRGQRRWNTILTHLAEWCEFDSVDAFLEEFSEHADEEWFQENIRESLSNMMAALDDAVLPSIAKLIALHHRGRSPTGPLRRQVGQLLADMTAGDLDLIVRIVRWADQQATATTTVMEAIIGARTGEDAVKCRYVELAVRGSDGEPSVAEMELRVGDDTRRAFYLLKRHGLGTDNASGYHGAVSGPHVILLRPHTVAHLSKILVSVPRPDSS